MKSRAKILLLLLLALLLGVILLLPHGGYRRQVEAYKKQLLAQGEKLTMLELAPPPATNGQNGAIALTNAMEGFRVPSDYPPKMKMIWPGVAMVGHSNTQPVEMAGYASNVVKSAELRSILQAPTLDFNLDYSKGSELPLRHLLKLKYCETLLSVAATQALHEKDYSEAWPDLIAGVELIRLYDNEPIMISELVRIAMARIAIAATWEILHTGHPWSATQLAELQAKWQEINLFNHPDAMMAMERAFGIDELTKARSTNDGQALLGVMTFTSATGGPSTAGSGWLPQLRDKAKELYNRYPRFWFWKSSGSYDEELYYLQITTTGEAAARRMMATNAFVPIYNQLLADETNVLQLHPRAEKSFLLIMLGEDLFSKYLLRLADAETARRMTVTAIALDRFHLQNSAYPASLNDLVPAFLTQVPTDFMDGKPLRYRLQSDGNFLLYSVGEDGKDDGGDATPGSPATDWTRARDIVWPRAATPQELADYLKRHPPETNSLAK